MCNCAFFCVCLALAKPGPDVLGASLLSKPSWNVLELACCHWAGQADNTFRQCASGDV